METPFDLHPLVYPCVNLKLLHRYRASAKSLSSKGHVCFVNVVLFLCGAYVPLQKLLAFSVSGGLTRIFSVDAGIWAKFILIMVVSYAVLMRIILFVVEAFPAFISKTPSPECINHCVLRINEEITEHLNSVIAEPDKLDANLLLLHRFKVNVGLVVGDLATHLQRAFSSIKVSNHDIFISVYQVEGFEKENWEPKVLEYVTHWHLQSDLVATRSIMIDDPAYSAYECVKAIRSGLGTVILLDGSGYAPSRFRRNETVKHYVGFRLEHERKTIGMINIEFHNHTYFTDEGLMTDFVEKEMIAFRYLIEYQFLKRKFFTTIQKNLPKTGGDHA